jgi:hypothetical protein
MKRPDSADAARLDAPAEADAPAFRPVERFWPYADLAENPGDEELAALHPELRTALFGRPPLPFSITLVFPRFEAADYDKAVAMARGSAEYVETGRGAAFRHHARFYPDQAMKLRDLFEIVGRVPECEVLVDDAPVPYARELWLPLFWFLIPR